MLCCYPESSPADNTCLASSSHARPAKIHALLLSSFLSESTHLPHNRQHTPLWTHSTTSNHIGQIAVTMSSSSTDWAKNFFAPTKPAYYDSRTPSTRSWADTNPPNRQKAEVDKSATNSQPSMPKSSSDPRLAVQPSGGGRSSQRRTRNVPGL